MRHSLDTTCRTFLNVLQLVVWFAVCDIFVDLSFFMGTPQDGSAGCYAQASLLQFFQVCTSVRAPDIHVFRGQSFQLV